MRLLLDTHVFRWYITADARLPVGPAVAAYAVPLLPAV